MNIIYGSYDCMEDHRIYTNEFTQELDQIVIMNKEHLFYIYLKGLLLNESNNIIDHIIHAYYHIDTKLLHIWIGSCMDDNSLNIIYYAWNYFWKSKSKQIDVKIFESHCGTLYQKSYVINEIQFYKSLINYHLALINH